MGCATQSATSSWLWLRALAEVVANLGVAFDFRLCPCIGVIETDPILASPNSANYSPLPIGCWHTKVPAEQADEKIIEARMKYYVRSSSTVRSHHPTLPALRMEENVKMRYSRRGSSHRPGPTQPEQMRRRGGSRRECATVLAAAGKLFHEGGVQMQGSRSFSSLRRPLFPAGPFVWAKRKISGTVERSLVLFSLPNLCFAGDFPNLWQRSHCHPVLFGFTFTSRPS